MDKILLVISYIIAVIHLLLKPERVPIHWNIQGEVDKYASYPWGILISPIVITLVVLLFTYIKKIDPFIKEKSRKWIPAINILILLFIGIQIFSLMYVWFTPTFSFFPVLMGVFLIVFGNYMPTIPRNGFIGIRTPWTLSSEEVWNKTHRISGYWAIITGIICAISVFLPYSNYISIGMILLWAFGSIFISFGVWYKMKH